MRGEVQDPRKEFGAEVTRLAQTNDNIVALSADSYGSSGLGKFKEQFPDRFFEIGIAEQAAVGFSAGLATFGKIPVFCAIAPFVTARPYEMFRNDLGYMRQNAKVVGRNGGMTYSDLGSTHYSLDDYSIMSSIPGVAVLSPSDPASVKACVRAMIKHQGPVYMRVGASAMPCLYDDYDIEVGIAKKVKEGKDISVFVTGQPAANATEAVERLEKEGISVDFYDFPTVWPLDEDAILESAKKTGKVVVIEEHFIHGGFGSMVADYLAGEYPVPVKKIAVPNEYLPTGPYKEVVKKYGLDADGIYNSIKAFI